MQYDIMNREKASEASLAAVGPATAIISIINADAPSNRFGNADWIKGVLEIRFNDTPAGYPDCITEADARKMAEYVYEMAGLVNRFIVQCEYGVSRSAAIAAAMMLCLDGDDSVIWGNEYYAPNKTCYRLMLVALEKMKSERDSVDVGGNSVNVESSS